MKKDSSISKYYDWGKTLSYDALLTFVITSRGRGKTYGIRKQCIKDYLKDKSTFAEICRYKDEIKYIKNGYFDKLEFNNEFPDYIFKIEGTKAYIAKKPSEYNDESKKKKQKTNWEFIGAFYALSEYQNVKKRTHVNLKRVIMDEAIIEKLDKFHKYYENEYDILLNIIDSLSREDVHTKKIKTRIYLLSNACDLINPYFIKFGINDIPPFNYSWHNNKNVLIHYEKPNEYAQMKRENTLSGILASDNLSATSVDNLFIKIGEEFIAAKPKNAKFSFGIKLKEHSFGIWADYSDCIMYINNKIPNGDEHTIYTLYREDNTLNTTIADKAHKSLQVIKELYYSNQIRYTSYSVMELFSNVLQILGIR